MTHADHKVIFTALGFLAVIMNNVPQDKQAKRAGAIADLIESFCRKNVPEAFGDNASDTQNNNGLLQDAMKALEAVIEEGLNYSTEQDVDEVIAKIKQAIK